MILGSSNMLPLVYLRFMKAHVFHGWSIAFFTWKVDLMHHVVIFVLRFTKPHGFPWLINCVLYLKTKFNASYDYLCENEGNNLTSMAITLCSIVHSCPLKLYRVYEGACFSHIMSKACQYATTDEKVTIGLK